MQVETHKHMISAFASQFDATFHPADRLESVLNCTVSPLTPLLETTCWVENLSLPCWQLVCWFGRQMRKAWLNLWIVKRRSDFAHTQTLWSGRLISDLKHLHDDHPVPLVFVSLSLIITKRWGRHINTRQMVKEKQLNESRDEAEIHSIINYCEILVFGTQIYQSVMITAALIEFFWQFLGGRTSWKQNIDIISTYKVVVVDVITNDAHWQTLQTKGNISITLESCF